MTIEASDLDAWSGLELVSRVEEGNRNEVWRARVGDRSVSVRRSRRSQPSLAWELEFIEFLAAAGFFVAEIVPSDDGRGSVDGLVVQQWIEGTKPASPEDWIDVADTLRRLHLATIGYRQRPGCCTVLELAEARRSVDADLDQVPPALEDLAVRVFASFADVPVTAIHGDPDQSNLRMLDNGQVGLLDFDESRVDITMLDLANLGAQDMAKVDHRRGLQLSDAWEAVNGWTAEPDYARRRYESLVRSF